MACHVQLHVSIRVVYSHCRLQVAGQWPIEQPAEGQALHRPLNAAHIQHHLKRMLRHRKHSSLGNAHAVLFTCQVSVQCTDANHLQQQAPTRTRNGRCHTRVHRHAAAACHAAPYTSPHTVTARACINLTSKLACVIGCLDTNTLQACHNNTSLLCCAPARLCAAIKPEGAPIPETATQAHAIDTHNYLHAVHTRPS